MNTGAQAGQAYGFELESLRLLASVKTFDNSMTMMVYLYECLFAEQPTLLDVFDELKPIKIVARMEIDLIDKSVKSIKNKVDLVKSAMCPRQKQISGMKNQRILTIKTGQVEKRNSTSDMASTHSQEVKVHGSECDTNSDSSNTNNDNNNIYHNNNHNVTIGSLIYPIETLKTEIHSVGDSNYK